ncbi:MAG: hypothetical protein EOP36_13165 [Rubrivivax sp.]|nr:MAG: hypothetical protein EOP36_13165 [Rubrivivax sp.]
MTIKLTVYIAQAGTPLKLEGGIGSKTGHMWWSVDDGSGPRSYGFAPIEHGKTYGPGKIWPNDLDNYESIYVKQEFSISQDQYRDLVTFAGFPELAGFNTYYLGPTNNCIDFTWAALRLVGINPHGFDGAVWPAWNKGYLKSAWDDYLKNNPQKDVDWEIDWKYTFDGQVLINPICKPKSRPVDSDANNHYQDAVTYRPRDPLAIDLTGDGIKTVAINPAALILFDHNGDGSKSATGWLQGSDAWLVRDINSNGTIDSGLELFGVDTDVTINGIARKATNGFEALRALDDGDNVFSATEANSKKVLLWRDLNQNGVSDAGELSTFANNGIVSIALNYTLTNTDLGGGNSITGKAVVTRSTGISEIDSVKIGSDSSANNLDLADNPFYRTFPSMALTAAAQALPEMRGSGSVRDLREAMSLTSTQATALVATVTQFKQATTRDAQMALIDQLIQKWGATSLMQTSASATTNATSIAAFASSQPDLYKKIIALERFNGVTSLSSWANSSAVNIPGPVLSLLNSSYQALKESVYGALAMQTRLAAYLNAVNVAMDSAGFKFDTSALSSKLETLKNSDAKGAFIDLVELNKYGFDVLASLGFNGLGKLRSWIDALAPNSPLRTTIAEVGVFVGAQEDGTSARDIYIGNAANNYFNGGDGDDLLSGGAGYDVLDGRRGNDFLVGDEHFDQLSGGDGNDTLDGGVGNDRLWGANGADTYLFGKGAGQDTIGNSDEDETGTNADTILLGAGITPDDVRLKRFGDEDLLITINGVDDTLKAQSYFQQDGTSTHVIENLKFANGTIWDVATVKAKVLFGNADHQILKGYASNDTINAEDGHDLVYGQAGHDSLDGGGGADELQGGEGNDTLMGGTGADYLSGGNDTDALYGDAGNDTLDGGMGNDMLNGGRANDTLYGSAGNDTLDGGLGNDYLNGGTGADIYLFGIGSGQDTVYNQDDEAVATSADTILLGAGITTSGVTLTRSSDDLFISLNGTYDNLRVQSYFSQDGISSNVVENLKFADGTVWDVATVKARVMVGTVNNDSLTGYASNDQISAGDGNDLVNAQAGNDSLDGGAGKDTLQGGEGNDTLKGGAEADNLSGGNGNDALQGNEQNDTLSGDAGNDTLEGGAGNDYLNGGNGADTYQFGIGSGQDTVSNQDGEAVGTNTDTILLGAGIATSGVTLTRSSDDLLISLTGTYDNLRVQSYFSQGGISSNVVENLKFADGTVWDVATVKSKVMVSTANNDSLTGYDSSDTINSGNGNDLVIGQAGNDSLDGGTGKDTLQGGDGNDTLQGGTGADYISGGNGNDALQGNEHDDTLWGDVGNDTLDGGTGNDYLYGSTGADTYLFGTGSGQDTISNSDADAIGTNADTILLGTGITTTGVTLTRVYDDLHIGIKGTDDSLKVQYYFYEDATSRYLVENLKFDDGTVWDLATVKAKVLVSTANKDNLTGYASNDTIIAGDGNDLVNGQAGHDSLDGGAGADTLYGGDGNNTLKGGAGGDNLSGGNGNDILLGNEQNDTLSGYAGNDTLDGGSGNDEIYGGMGADIYLFGTGSGQDTINNYDPEAADTILLGVGITTNGVTLTRSGDDLLISLNGTYDNLKVQNYFSQDGNSGHVVENLQFTDGTIWDYATAKSKLSTITTPSNIGVSGTVVGENLTGGLGNDTLYGQAGNDTLNGQAGNDTLDGGVGNDIYLFGKGSGKDTISSYDGAAGKLDTIQLGVSVLTAEMILSRESDDLVLSIKGTADSLRVEKYFVNDATFGYQVEQIKFADGTAWNQATVKTKVVVASNDNDNLTGYATADSFSGLAGDDAIYARADNDTLDGGAGEDRLYGEDGEDLLKGGEQNDLLDGGNHSDNLQGQDGNDTLYGQAGDDTLDGGLGYDILNGGDGNDIYLFGKGSGKDTINSYESAAGKLDTIQLGAGVLITDVLLSRESDDLVLSIKGTTDSLRVGGYFTNDASYGYQVEQIKFASGTVWDMATVKTKVAAATSDHDSLTGYATADNFNGLAGDDTIYARAGSDTLDGGAGNDYLVGGDGNDIYLFGKSSGKDVISSYESTVGKQDTIQLGAGVLTTDLALIRESNDLVLLIKGTTDSLRVGNYFTNDASSGYQVEQIKFADGTVWDVAAVKAKVTAATSDNDYLMGYAGVDNLSGLAGDDIIYAGAGNDTLVGGAGEDRLYGEHGEDLLKGGPQNDFLDGGYNADNLQGEDGDDSVYGQEGNDTLNGGAGSDYLVGGDGNDTYLFGKGSGKDTISSYESRAGKLDTIQVGAGVLTTDMVVNRAGNDLVLSIKGTTDSLRVEQYFTNDAIYGYQVEQVKFADGTVWDVAAVKTKAATASNDDDSLMGYATADNFSGLVGDDSIYAQAGNDTLDGGMGEDRLYGEDGDDLLKGGTHGDFLDGGNHADNLQGQDGNDDLYGRTGNDTLNGGPGNDYLAGGDGNDTYLFGKGDGQDMIDQNYAGEVDDLDILQFKTGVASHEISVIRSGVDLVLSITGTPDQVTVDYFFIGDDPTNSSNPIQQVKFTDGGIVWDIAAIKAKYLTGNETAQSIVAFKTADLINAAGGSDTIVGQDGDDTINGGAGDDALYGSEGHDSISGDAGNDDLGGGNGDDTLIGGLGNDLLDGGYGNNTYLFAKGDGQDTIGDYENYLDGKLNTLQFKDGIAASQLAVKRVGNHLELSISGSNDTVTISSFFVDNGWNPVQQIKFTDGGSIWNLADIATLANAKLETGTATAETLNGVATPDALYGLAGNDTLTALAGNDFLFGGLGDDSLDGGADNDWLFGDAGEDNLVGGLGNDTLHGGDGDDFLSGGTGDDSLVGGTGDDTYIVGSAGDVVVELAGDVNGVADHVMSSISYSINQSSTVGVEDLTLTGAAHINGIGNALDNCLTGNSGNNVLDGLSGADAMFGNAGNDIYVVNSADDLVYEFEGTANGIADEVKSSVSYSINQQFTQGVENLTLTGTGNISGTGNASSNLLTGNSGANALTGGGGNDTYRGGLGADTLTASSTASNDTYIWGRGEGADTLTDAGGTDQFSVLAGVTADQLWLRHVGNNLELSVIGTSDKFTINNWYTAAANQIESVKLSDGKALTASKVENLVNAMAGFTPPASGQTTLPANYQASLNQVIASNWA